MTTHLPTVVVPGYLAGAGDYEMMARLLSEQGAPAFVVPIQWYSWLPTVGDRPMTPVLTLIAATIDRALREHPRADRVNLVGHSAGGWISRLLLGDKPYDGRTWDYRQRVATLITLGTPHLSLEKFCRNNMTFVNTTYPGAFYGSSLRYVCVAGRAIYGRRGGFWDNFTYRSYELTSGRGDVWGDGITPVEAAHLVGAENLTLEGIYHSPRGSRPWYGSAEPFRAWAEYLQ